MKIIIIFTDQSSRLLEIEYKFNLTLLINKQKYNDILQNQEQENMLTLFRMGFFVAAHGCGGQQDLPP